MYGHIQKANYFRLLINDRKTFNQIHEKKILEIDLKDNDKCQRALSVDNEFIRFIYKDWYMDITIRKIIPRDGFVVHLGQCIDYCKPFKM